MTKRRRRGGALSSMGLLKRCYSMTSLPPAGRIWELWEMWSSFAVGRIHPVLVVCGGAREREMLRYTQRDDWIQRAPGHPCAFSLCTDWIALFRWHEEPVYRRRERETAHSHFSGGVMVMDCAVNSSSKYLVSVSDETCGMNGGTSWTERSLLYTIMYKLNVLELTYTTRLVVFKISIFCSSRQHLCDQNTVKPEILLNTIYITLPWTTKPIIRVNFWNWDLYIINNIWSRYNYLKIWNLRVQKKNQNIEKIAFKVVQMKCILLIKNLAFIYLQQNIYKIYSWNMIFT